MSTYLATRPRTTSDAVARVLTELAENDFLYWLIERDRAQIAARALATGATFEQVADVMELGVADVRALVA